jgi:hypothetical protein
LLVRVASIRIFSRLVPGEYRMLIRPIRTGPTECRSSPDCLLPAGYRTNILARSSMPRVANVAALSRFSAYASTEPVSEAVFASRLKSRLLSSLPDASR